MAANGSPLAQAVVEALRRGDILDAVERLRAAGDAGRRGADRLVDDRPARGTAGHVTGEATKSGAAAPSRPALHAGAGFPPAVVSALAQGHKLDAIRLLREHTGLGLKEAKDAIDASPLSMVAGSGGLSPGEVPRTRDSLWPVVVAVMAVAAWWFWRRHGVD